MAKKPLDPERQRNQELRSAPQATLDCQAISSDVKALLDDLTQLLCGHEQKQSKKPPRKDTKASIRKVLEAFLGDLLSAQRNERAAGWVYHSQRHGDFSGETVGSRGFKRVSDALEALKLLDVVIGYQDWIDWGSGVRSAGHRHSSRFRATPALVSYCVERGVRAADVDRHFKFSLPTKPLQLREATWRNIYGDKFRGKLVDFTPTSMSNKLQEEVRELNKFFDKATLGGGVHRGYVRSFNETTDPPEFTWNKGGRLYCHGGEGYQQMSR